MTLTSPRLIAKVVPAAGGMVPWWRTEIGSPEVEAVAEAMRGERLGMGVVTATFEAAIARAVDVPYVVAVPSGSVALLLAMMALDVGRGDEVIVPGRTFIATAHAPYWMGAKVVLADSLPDEPGVDVADIAAKITSRTKAIMAVHLNGRACAMGELRRLAARHRIAVVEDAAQAFLARGEGGFLGTLGDCGIYSFGMVKLVSMGQGGAVVTQRKDLYEKLKLLRNHGFHDIASLDYLGPGLNFKVSDVLSAIGVVQMRRGADKVRHCLDIYRRYAEGLAGQSAVRLLPARVDDGECPAWAEVLCDDRGRLVDHLSAHGVQTRLFLPCLSAARHLDSAADLPRSRALAEKGLILPCGPAQPMENVDRTIGLIRDFLAGPGRRR